MELSTIVPSVRPAPAERADGDLGYFNGRPPKQQHNPVWQLEDEEEFGLTGFYGRVLDVSYNILPNLRGIAAVPSFVRLTVMSLKETGIEHIELLRCCSMLVYLDLSSNEIVDLIGDEFWACFPNLLVLLLHGNKVKDWCTMVSLGLAPRLTYLTLFYNPVSKMKMYRTFAANYCESLRGLDRHVISDEEVIQSAKFFLRSRYRTYSAALALPQALFEGLTEVVMAPPYTENEGSNATMSVPARSDYLAKSCHSVCQSLRDDQVLASVTRRVELLRKFHARHSPVIILQREIRRFLIRMTALKAIVIIQARARMWMVGWRAMDQLRQLLSNTGELYLLKETLTPSQIGSVIVFQRRILGYLRSRVQETCARRVAYFVVRMKKKFSSFVACLDRAEVAGVVVREDSVGELKAAIVQALMVTFANLTKDEATREATMHVSAVSNCRLLRPFSYASIADWPLLREDVGTDGIFIIRSHAARELTGERYEPTSQPAINTESMRPLSGLRDDRKLRDDSKRPSKGLFDNICLRRCKIRRRGVSFCRHHGPGSSKSAGDSSLRKINLHEQLWVFHPADARMLARVMCILRNSSRGKPPVPFIFERHMFRCAATTRIQAAWRGHVCRWNLLTPLTSCLIVSRAAICLQRWWRHLRGLAKRLRLCRRLWTLASSISCPVMYMEHDVFYILTRRCHSLSYSNNGVQFVLQSGVAVGVVKERIECESRQEWSERGHSEGFYGLVEPAGARRLPLWASGCVIPHATPSEVEGRVLMRQVGILLTEGVQVKRVVWPVSSASDNWVAIVEQEQEAHHNNGTTCAEAMKPCCGYKDALEFSSTEIGVENTARTPCERDCILHLSSPDTECAASTAPSVDLRESHGTIDMVELTFANTREARARALLVTAATEEAGMAPNQPIAPLMTFGMLQRAAARKLGGEIPTLARPAHGYKCGDNVEVSMLRLSEGFWGSWYPGVVERNNGDGKYKVILDSGVVEPSLAASCLRPYDRTGREYALMEMSHLPSNWQRAARNILTPSDRLESELLRRTLPPTTLAPSSPTSTLIALVADRSPQTLNHDRLFADEDGKMDGVNVRDLKNLVRLGVHKYDSNARLLSPDPSQADRSVALHWEGSKILSTTRAEALAAGALNKVERAATKGVAMKEGVATATRWMPGNRFRRDLEKLVSLAAQEAKDTAAHIELDAKRQAVLSARTAGKDELTPRQRLQRLKTAQIAIFRRQAEERRNRTATENAAESVVRSDAVAEAREDERDSTKTARLEMKVRRANRVADIERREGELGEEREREKQRRQRDVKRAKNREQRRRIDRARQAATRTESNLFTTNASELLRHVRRHSSLCNKARESEGMRKWVKEQRVHKDDMRRRLLERVKELQDQKRLDAMKQRKILAAHGRARMAIDGVILQHRLGDPTHFVDELGHDVMKVLRPSSARDGGQTPVDDVKSGTNAWESTSQSPDHRRDISRNRSNGYLRSQRPHLSSKGTAPGGIENKSLVAGAGRYDDADPNNVEVECTPTRPSRSRWPCSQNQMKRCLHPPEDGTGKTVVVLASIPTVAAATRTKLARGPPSALFGRESSHSLLSAGHQQQGAGDKKLMFMRASQNTTAQDIPWPMGRRWW